MEFTLKGLRTNKGLSRKEAADMLGVSPDTLGNYERGKTFPDVPVIRKIEKLYGVEYRNIIFLPKDYPLRVNGA